MTKEKEKYLQPRGNVWWLYYRLPTNLRNHPSFEKYKKSGIYTQSLKTDSLILARRFRDEIISNLLNVDDEYTTIKKQIIEKSKSYVQSDPYLKTYQSFLKNEIVVKAMKLSRQNRLSPLENMSHIDRLTLDVLNGKVPDGSNLLKNILKKVVDDKKSEGQAPKTISKISRSVDWFLAHALKDDVDITTISYDQVNKYLLLDKANGVYGSTLNGYLYGLRQVWQRAKKSKIVAGDNPFSEHGISKNSEHYDPFTYDEIHELCMSATGELNILIHAGATTGARLNELLSSDILIPESVDYKCWLFKFKDRGKTAQSTRAVPIHSSLHLDLDFRFTISDRTVTRDFKALVDKTIKIKTHQLTGKPRKLSFHSLRTSFITYLAVEKRISEIIVGAVTGHLAGGVQLGSYKDYVNANDLNSKRKTVEEIIW